MKIFFGEKDIDYSANEKYAFLNWRFDDSAKIGQDISSNFEMGKAYLANAILALYCIIHTHNINGIADSLIFPILFDIWHGIELLLKSGIASLLGINKETIKDGKTHEISKLFGTFKDYLLKIEMEDTANQYLVDLSNLICEFERVNAHFDFARYPTDTQGNKQFYNATHSDEKQWQDTIGKPFSADDSVPNTCVDILVLFKSISKIAEELIKVVGYLEMCCDERGKPTDANFSEVEVSTRNFEDSINSDYDYNQKCNPIKVIVEYILSKIIS